MAQMIDIVPNKGGSISSSSPFLVFENVVGMLMPVRHCICICDSNIDHSFMLVFQQSSEEDVTALVSIVGCWRIFF
jgi:hypothetical protein